MEKAFGAKIKWIHWVPCLVLLKSNDQDYSRIPPTTL